MVRNTAVSGNDGRGRFARPPWTKKSSEWRRIDARIADGHLAHHVNQAVELLSCRGSQRVRNETATAVLVHNLLYVYRATAEPCIASAPASNAERDGNSPIACSA